MGLIPLNMFVQSDGRSKRSHLTCLYKCGDACSKPVPNESDNEYFQDVARAALSRRGVLRAGGIAVLATGAGSVLAACGSPGDDNGPTAQPNATGAVTPGTPDSARSPEGMRFTAVAANKKDEITVPPGYEHSVLIRWGDPVLEGAPAFDFEHQSATAAARQFGYNNDFAALLPIPGESNAFAFVANHEYTTEVMMFRGYNADAPTREHAEIAWASHGLTVLEVTSENGGGKLTPRMGRLNRRITATTPFEFTGPAAGDDLLKTPADASGRRVLGTLNNCAGGVTPWGTILSGEENCDQYFANADDVQDAALKKRLKRYSVKGTKTERKWERFDERFDVTKTPNEPNRFFWLVEVDPFDPESTPLKHTATGRFKHEGGTIHVTDDGTVVCYSGDDERFEYIYKFVSSRKMQSGRSGAALRHNMGILTEGTLYVAKFAGNSPENQITGDGRLPEDGDFDGTGEWLKLVTSKADGTAESHVEGFTGVEALVYTREAADKAGATKMDRPEDVEPNPASGKIYVALTNNKNRGKTKADGTPYAGVDEANPRVENKNGQILEIDDDHTGTSFTWNLLLVCGDPATADTYFGGFDKTKVSPISCPDNLAFDEHGNLWISTDGNALGSNDGLYAVALEGERRGETKCFLTVPTGAETCGPIIERNRVIVNVQHPGEIETDQGHPVGATGDPVANPASHWPDGGNAQPRPAAVVVWGSGAIGS